MIDVPQVSDIFKLSLSETLLSTSNLYLQERCVGITKLDDTSCDHMHTGAQFLLYRWPYIEMKTSVGNLLHNCGPGNLSNTSNIQKARAKRQSLSNVNPNKDDITSVPQDTTRDRSRKCPKLSSKFAAIVLSELSCGARAGLPGVTLQT